MIQRGRRISISALGLAGRLAARAAAGLEWAWLRRELNRDPELSLIFATFKQSPESRWSVEADDVLRLYRLVIRHQPEHILEFGTGIGLSTAAMALALDRLGRGLPDQLASLKLGRSRQAGRLTTIEQDQKCLELAKHLIPPELQSPIRFLRADPEVFQIPAISRWLYFCGYAWRPEPETKFDFVLVDGPAGWYRAGELVSLQSGEVIRVLPFLRPGALVYIDGRRSLVKTLKRYLGNYLILHEAGSEYALFRRTERTLTSLADLEICDSKRVSPSSLYAHHHPH